MDVNEYMKQSLSLLERIAEGIESLNESGIFIANQNDLENAIPVVILGGGVSNVTNAEADKKAKAEAEKKAKAEADAKAKKEADAKAKAEADKKAKADADADADADAKAKAEADKKDTGKKVTADDARKALKAYAAIEGNDAAMELLNSFGAPSITALAEQGDDKLAELVAKCGG